jgi:phosphoribosylamine--glycine ligase
VSTKRVLVIGSGGREHALAWRAVQEGHDVLVAPGSEGIEGTARCVGVAVRDADGLVALAKAEHVDLVVVGPEQPLVDGLADRLRAADIDTLGPGAAGARLEGSKAFAKDFMRRHGIPTAAASIVRDVADGCAALRRFAEPPVVKASGLAAGKGVVVPETFEEAETALRDCLERGAFGAAGATVVLEERLSGEELSFFVLTDGAAAVAFAPSQDHKRLGDGDAGPNTGGMGACAPAPRGDERVCARILAEVVEPTLVGLRADGTPYRGVLFVGLMIDERGAPFVIEYNVRFGDPEVQPLMFGAVDPVVGPFLAAARGELDPGTLRATPAATVVLAAPGYPGEPARGIPIRGLERASARPEVAIFHAGTRRDGHGGWCSDGGRVLGVCARGPDVASAVARAYQAVDDIEFPGARLRRDIGWRAR